MFLNVSSMINHRIQPRGFRKIVASFSQWSFNIFVCLIAGDLSQSAGYELLQFYRWLHRKYSVIVVLIVVQLHVFKWTEALYFMDGRFFGDLRYV